MYLNDILAYVLYSVTHEFEHIWHIVTYLKGTIEFIGHVFILKSYKVLLHTTAGMIWNKESNHNFQKSFRSHIIPDRVVVQSYDSSFWLSN